MPGPIALHLSSLRSVLLAWLCGGLLSLFGALSLAELGAMFPGTGGLYTYLRHAYGKPIAFLYGWGLLSMIHTGSIATLGSGFGLYLSRIFTLSPLEQKFLTVASVLFLTLVNLLGVHAAKHFQNASTIAKFAGLFILGALLFARGHLDTLSQGWKADMHASSAPVSFGVALVAVLWAYEGWHVVSFTAGEFKAPQRDLPISLISGTLVVAAIYLVLNVAYYAVLTPSMLQGTPSAAAAAMTSAYGIGATRLVSILILLSIVGAMNGMILTGPRVYYAMAHDGTFLPAFGKTSLRFRVPTLAIVVQGLWASALTLLGNFQQLFTSVVFTAWIFYGLAVAAVIVLRIRKPDLARPFRTPAFPLLPALFILAAAFIVISTVANQPKNAAVGTGLVLIGIPLYLFFRSRQKAADLADVASLEVTE